MNRQDSMTDTKHNVNNTKNPQKKHRLGKASKIYLLEGLN